MIIISKIILITGSRRGLGLAIAYRFAEAGYHIILNDFLECDKLEMIAADIRDKYGVRVLVCFGDVSNESVVISMLETCQKEFGKLDVLVNNAAIVTDMELSKRPFSLFQETMNNNVNSVYLMSKYFGKFIDDTCDGVGKIINIASTNGIDCNFPTSIDYDASKAAIISLTKNFALEYAPKVLVNAVAPGWICTDMNADLSNDVILEESEKIYVKRFAEPFEIASLVYYLGSEENTYVNNEVIKIDGGY